MSVRYFDELFPGAASGTLVRCTTFSSAARDAYGDQVFYGLPLVSGLGQLCVKDVEGRYNRDTPFEWELVDTRNLGLEDVARLRAAGLYREAIPETPGAERFSDYLYDTNGLMNPEPGPLPVLEGRKDDSGKVRIELFPGDALFAISQVLAFGAKKYADRNWEKGMKWGRVFGALQRHLWAWWQGKAPTTKSFLFGELDSETGFSHLWHAGCCVVFLIAYEERKAGEDDRPGAI